ncbi:hypothetical protein CC78DRAFT_576494 [Lojkania enalia]|uniref:Histone chaperone domain-containing protein n=1 Tax=Lojkania enalia TaxID=147567 RepID=A0A9P4KF02_9PLEO|nr:hypothetical protein CC78DRAFT_576494 [Didymosphaeria enalia]
MFAASDDQYEQQNNDIQDSPTARDENEAIDSSDIVEPRARRATRMAGTYTEPGDEEGLPGPN